MTAEDLKERTRAFAVSIIRLSRALPKDQASQVMSKQLVRCGTSVGANYRAACLPRSRADMIAKLKIVEEEVDESRYWLQLLQESDSAPRSTLEPLQREATELFSIMVASIKTLKSRE